MLKRISIKINKKKFIPPNKHYPDTQLAWQFEHA